MSGIGHNSGESVDTLNSTAQAVLRNTVERIERLIEDRSAVNEDIKEVIAEAKGQGFDTKILRKVVRIRAMDRAKRMEEQALIGLYMGAINGRADDEDDFSDLA